MINTLMENVYQSFGSFVNTAKRLNQKFSNCRFTSNEYGTQPVEVAHYTVKDKAVHLTEENIEHLKSLCSVYLETEFQHKLWDALNKAREKLMEAKVLLVSGKVDIPMFYTRGNPGFIDEDMNLHGELMDFRTFDNGVSE